MIAGIVPNRRPTVPLVVRGPSGQEAGIEAMLDTGFTGYLAMPPALVAALSLPFTNYHNATLAHGRVVRVDVHEATVLWDGEERMVSVLAIGHDPLIGMSLMDGSEVHLQVADGGSIMIEPL